MTNTLKNNFISNLLVSIFWIFLIFLFLNELFIKPYNYNTDTFINTIATTSKIKVYNFNTSWCGYSKKFQPIWDKFVDSISNNINIDALDKKCDNNKNIDLVKKYNIEGYPTIIIDDGKTITKYEGNRTVNGLRQALNLDSIVDNTQEAVIPSNIRCGNQFNNYPHDSKITIYHFYTTWCGYSKKFKPIWDKFIKHIPKDNNIVIVEANCDDNKYFDLIEKYNVKGFPTLVKVHNNNFSHYTGEKTVNGLLKSLNLPLLPDESESGDSESNKTEKVVRFKNNQKTIYNFNTSWCSYSVKFQPIWDKFSKIVENTNINTFDVKCDNSDNEELCNKYKISGYPSIVIVDNDNVINYNGPRTVEDLISFINK